VVKGRDDVVLAHLNHRLVQMCLRLLREELWKLDEAKKLHRVSVKKISDSQLSVPAVLMWSRLVITGGDQHRLHEEIILSGGELKHSGYSRITQQGKLNELLQNSESLEPSESLLSILKERFEKQEGSVSSAMEARSKDRLRFLESTLTRRRDSEISDLLNILDELERTIRNELKDDALPKQALLPGFEPEERTQIRKDIEALLPSFNYVGFQE
jgi:hypothetical protein